MRGCLGLNDRCLPRKAETSLGMKNITHFPPNYYYNVKSISGGGMGKGITVLH